jgi:AcrR family transcriptional regulator
MVYGVNSSTRSVAGGAVAEDDIPRTLALLWGRTSPGRRGPKPGLTVEAIGRAAIAVADAQGLEAVSMKRVAEAVGVSTMALYRYVQTKDDVFLLMLELVTGPAPDLGRRRTWRAKLETWCRAYRAVLVAHPWVVQVPVTAPPNTPQQLAWMEAAIAAMDGMRLSPQEQTQVLLQLNVYVRGDAALNESIQPAGHAQDGGVSGTWARQVLALTTAEDFPAVHALLASGEFDEDDDPMEQFEFGLQRTLDGIALLVEQRSR